MYPTELFVSSCTGATEREEVEYGFKRKRRNQADSKG